MRGAPPATFRGMRLLVLSMAFVATSVLPAQVPGLAGTWVYVPGQAPATLPAAPSGVLGARFSLALESGAVTLTRPVAEFGLVSRYSTDGARTNTRIPGRACVGEAVFHETATWEGASLVIAVVGTTPPGARTPVESRTRRVLRLESPDLLVVEGTISQQGQSRVVGAVYRRSTDALPAPRPPHAAAAIAATIDRVAWIGTSWSGTAAQVTTEERWTPPASGAMMATARTMRNGAVGSYEFLCIAERDGSLAYVAMPDGRTTPTVFMLTALTDTSATFENPAHDYPQLIRYARTPEGHLQTTIAGTNGARARTVRLEPARP